MLTIRELLAQRRETVVAKIADLGQTLNSLELRAEILRAERHTFESELEDITKAEEAISPKIRSVAFNMNRVLAGDIEPAPELDQKLDDKPVLSFATLIINDAIDSSSLNPPESAPTDTLSNEAPSKDNSIPTSEELGTMILTVLDLESKPMQSADITKALNSQFGLKNAELRTGPKLRQMRVSGLLASDRINKTWGRPSVFAADTFNPTTATHGELVLEILQRNPEGMTAIEIREFSSRVFQRDVERTSLAPMLSVLSSRKQIIHDGAIWKINPKFNPNTKTLESTDQLT